MALKSTLIVFACAVAFPAAALAQPPAWALGGTAPCCTALTEGDALAATVLLPAPMVLPDDTDATALAASVLLPQADHAAHAMAGIACCQTHTPQPMASAEGTCQGMKDGSGCAEGCDMPCCQEVPPIR